MHKTQLLTIMILLACTQIQSMQEQPRNNAVTQYRFVLTGGSGVGKSTVIKLLNDAGYQTVPEAWSSLFDEAKKQNKLDEFLTEDPVTSREKIMDFQLALEAAIDVSKPVFLDRSTVDVVAFGQLYNVCMEQWLLDIPTKDCYDLVFFFDPLPADLYEKNKREEVHCSRAQSLQIEEYLKNIYTDMGFSLINVPFDTPSKRMDFILETIQRVKKD